MSESTATATLPALTGTAGVARRAPARPFAAFADGLTLATRCLRMSRRQVDALLMSLRLPVMLMLLFVYLFGGAIHTDTSYLTYVVPGVLLLCAGLGSAQTAVSVNNDLSHRIVDRFPALDIGGAAVPSGHVVASMVRNIVSTVVVFGVALLIGFRPHAGALDWLAAAGVQLAFVVALSWLPAAAGLLANSPEAASGFTFYVMFLPYPSSAFVQIDTMPHWLRGFTEHQPTTAVTESIRRLLLRTPVGSHPWQPLIWCSSILAGSVALSAALFRRRTA